MHPGRYSKASFLVESHLVKAQESNTKAQEEPVIASRHLANLAGPVQNHAHKKSIQNPPGAII